MQGGGRGVAEKIFDKKCHELSSFSSLFSALDFDQVKRNQEFCKPTNMRIFPNFPTMENSLWWVVVAAKKGIRRYKLKMTPT